MTPASHHTWSDHTLPVTSLVVGRGGVNGRVFTASRDNTCKIWDIPSGALLLSVTFATPILAICVDLAETALFGAGENGCIYKLNLLLSRAAYEGTAQAAITTLAGHDSAVTALACSFDGTLLLSGSSDSSAKVWDTRSLQNVSQFIQHKGGISAASVLPSPNAFSSGGAFGVPPAVLQRHPWQQADDELWEVESQALPGTTGAHTAWCNIAHTNDSSSVEMQRLHGSVAALQEENTRWKALCQELHQHATEQCVQSLSR